jgi:hypothetical protein
LRGRQRAEEEEKSTGGRVAGGVRRRRSREKQEAKRHIGGGRDAAVSKEMGGEADTWLHSGVVRIEDKI